DISLDGGTTFNLDLGPLNPLNTYPARYPNITASNYYTGSNPLNSQLLYYANILDGSGASFDGHVYGIGNPVTSGVPLSTEHYAFQGQDAHLPGGLCQSARGVYWATDAQGDGTAAVGNIYIYKGEFQPLVNDVVFTRTDTLVSNNYTGFSGVARVIGSNIAFAPDGQTGWVAWIGDLVGGPDSTYLPIFSKTTDCGDTWSTPVEVNLNSIAWIKDSLQTLWVDSLGNPASNGRATCAFDYDLTVDADGNPHLAVVICTGIDYSVSSGLAKFLGDVTTSDGGATWDVDYISPVLTFRTIDFGGTTQVNMDNFVQVARDEGGCNVFFSWADSDTAQVTGNGNGIGFGESTNLAPNLRISAKNVATGMKTYPKLVTDLDLLWEGAVLYPTLAPIVSSDQNGWELPIVTAVMSGSDPINPANFWYLGNDATIPNSNWCDPNAMNLSWDFWAYNAFVNPCSNPAVAFCNNAINGPCVPVAVQDPTANGLVLDDAYPNPTASATVIGLSLSAAETVVLTLHNSIGQQVMTIAQAELRAGKHQFTFDASDLPSGIYFYRLQTETTAVSKKLVVSH
ncbi:MAG TPA: T9SS type A sorting domain-containing protein, partial [Bacteroidia bacterium]|nr:T9SS type A sorting domain-containing protein [Bacteroidia bacterium]